MTRFEGITILPTRAGEEQTDNQDAPRSAKQIHCGRFSH